MNDLDIADIAAALEALSPGSGASVTRDDDEVRIAWQGAAPLPDETAIRTAILAIPQQQEEQTQRVIARRRRLQQLAQSAVGKDVATITPAEVRAMLALLLARFGALDASGAVRPLGEWL